jgi:hypothetical protein
LCDDSNVTDPFSLHAPQDARSLDLHKEAVRMLEENPELAERPLQVLIRWQSMLDASVLPLLRSWESIIRERRWSDAVADTEQGRHLRQASPLPVILPPEVRLEILGRYRRPRRADLEHIIRAASQVTNRYDIVVVGSQSIVGAISNPPALCMRSMEADVFPLEDEVASDLIDGAIVEASPFHVMYGYYAQGVDSTTSVLPEGWRGRLIRLQNENTGGRAGWCLEPTDLFLGKCKANREKDREFNVELIRHGIVKVDDALDRVSSMPVSLDECNVIRSLIGRLAIQASLQPGGDAVGQAEPDDQDGRRSGTKPPSPA